MAETDRFWEDVVPRVDPERCRRCLDCPPVVACLASAFRRDGPGSIPSTDEEVCFGCYSCAAACPYGAVILPRRQQANRDSR